MKDLSVANNIIKTKIIRIFNELVLSPSYYIEKIINKVFKGDNSTVKIPMDVSVHLSKNKDVRIY
jgi:hypothetical protein